MTYKNIRPEYLKEILEYLTSYLRWAESGAPNFEVFSRSSGLCVNLVYHFKSKNTPNLIIRGILDKFNQLLGGKSHPFGVEDYFRRAAEATMHECPNRLGWVREAIIDGLMMLLTEFPS